MSRVWFTERDRLPLQPHLYPDHAVERLVDDHVAAGVSGALMLTILGWAPHEVRTYLHQQSGRRAGIDPRQRIALLLSQHHRP